MEKHEMDKIKKQIIGIGLNDQNIDAVEVKEPLKITRKVKFIYDIKTIRKIPINIFDIDDIKEITKSIPEIGNQFKLREPFNYYTYTPTTVDFCLNQLDELSKIYKFELTSDEIIIKI